jgi:hypothetical protein
MSVGPIYPDSLQVKDALQLYFSKYHFKDGGYHEKWFRIRLGRLFIPLPNIKARVDAVKIHDIHHLVTGYEANWKGETEIAAWEIASGCDRYAVAWFLNLGSFFVGMLLYPRALFRAFTRGRRCATNLYAQTTYDDELLCSTLGVIRGRIGIDAGNRITLRDYRVFVLWCLFAAVYHAVVGFVLLYALCTAAMVVV